MNRHEYQDEIYRMRYTDSNINGVTVVRKCKKCMYYNAVDHICSIDDVRICSAYHCIRYKGQGRNNMYWLTCLIGYFGIIGNTSYGLCIG